MFRRWILVLLISLLVATGLMASNLQRVLDLNDDTYDLIEALYISQSRALPSNGKPWNVEEALFILQSIDYASLSDSEIKLYNRVKDNLEVDDRSFEANVVLAAEAYVHTDSTNFTQNSDWGFDYINRSPILQAVLQISTTDFFYGFINLSVGTAKFSANGTEPTTGKTNWFGTKVLSSNLQALYSSSDTAIEGTMPFRAFAAVGGPKWSFQIGRDRLSWGPGESGNFVLGEHVQYHNLARFSTYSKSFKYTFLTTFSPSPEEIYSEQMISPDPQKRDRSQRNPMKGLKMFMGHRFEWRMLSDRLGLVLTEDVIIQPVNGVIDLRVLNPMMLFHNFYDPSDANSIASVELNYSLHNFNFYIQAALDEFTASTESTKSAKVHPNALAYMAGTKFSFIQNKGVISGHLELAYTDPYLYFRSFNGDDSQKDDADNMSYVNHIRRWATVDNEDYLVYDPDFFGYKYGGDALVLDTAFTYKSFGSWEAGGGVFYMIHGMKNYLSKWELGPEAYATTFPSGGWDVATRTLDLRASGKIELFKGFTTYAQVDFISVANQKHQAGLNVKDLQMSLGVKYIVF